MPNEAIATLFNRLFAQYPDSIKVKSPYPETVLDMPLELASGQETLNIMPRIPNTTVKRIASGAKGGNLNDMLTLSMMYTVGLGVPEDQAHAMSWANFALVETGPLDFEQATADLDKDLKRLPDSEYSYPGKVESIYNSMIPKFRRVEPGDVPNDTYLLSPLIAGLRLYAIYRVKQVGDKSLCYLYDVRVGGIHGERVALEIANKLNLPNYIGSHGCEKPEHKKLMQPNYVGHMDDYFEFPPGYFVVAGTLAVPNSKKKFVRKVHPEARTTSDLLSVFLETLDVERKKVIDHPEYNSVNDLLKEAKARLERVRDGSEYVLLKEEFDAKGKEFRRAKRKGDTETKARLRGELKALKKFGAQIKKGTAEGAIETQIASYKQRLKAMESMNTQYRGRQEARYPENLFRFIATDIYYGKKGKTVPVPVGQHIDQHLMGIGFTVTNTSLLGDYFVLRPSGKKAFTPKTYRSAMKKLSEKYPDFNVSGIIARPVEMGSVKKPQKLPVYLVAAN